MNKKEIFQIVSRHLLEQGEPSFDNSGMCAYRGVDGKKCAVGCLIKDEFYSKGLEVISPSPNNLVGKALIASGIPDDVLIFSMLRHLQKIHDTFNPEDWKEHLSYYAKWEGFEE